MLRDCRLCLSLALSLATALSALGCAPHDFGDSDAALAVEDIAAGTGPSRLKATTSEPSRRLVEYDVDGRRYSADLYRSPQGTRAGIVLVPGVVPAGKDDARLVALANTLARLRFTVLVPDLLGLREFQVRRRDVGEVADAFRFLVSQTDWVPEGRAGIAGFSYGAGPVVLAALEPDIRAQVRFIVALGGYYDLRTIVTYFTTGNYREPPRGVWSYRPPDPYAKWVFTLSNTDLLEREEDRAALRALASGIKSEDEFDTMVTTSLQLRGRDAQALYALITNEDPSRVAGLIEQLPARMRDELEGINPAAHDLGQLEARVILLHGRDDEIIPYTESIALARAVPAGQVQLFLIEGFAHVDLRPRRSDLPHLLAAMEALLAQRVMAGKE